MCLALLTAVACVTSPSASSARAPSEGRSPFTCRPHRVIDGDTMRCGSVRVRLAHIDAPELPGHCVNGRRCTPGDAIGSTEHLKRLIGSASPQCRVIDRDRYGRLVSFCTARGVDLSCAQVAGGFAVERYGRLQCRGLVRWPSR